MTPEDAAVVAVLKEFNLRAVQLACEVVRLRAAVAEARETDARIADWEGQTGHDYNFGAKRMADRIAAAIRAQPSEP